MKSFKFILLLSLSIIIYSSCSEGINDPTFGSRDYIWEEDTLDVGQYTLTLNKIWASSSNDVWAIGFGPASRNLIWHYDGISWKQFPSEGINPQGICGFSKDNIWIADAYHKLWHYDGSELSLNQTMSYPGYNEIIFNDIAGKNTSEIYAVGYAQNYSDNSFKAIVARFDGYSWSFLDIPELIEGFGEIKYSKDQDCFYITSSVYTNNAWIEKIYMLKSRKIEEIFSTTEEIALGQIDSKVYLIRGQKVYKLNDSDINLWKDLTGTSIYSAPYGKSENNFISNAHDGIGHFNGTDYQTIYKTGLRLTAAVMIGDDIFQLANNFQTGKRIIIHGKLIN